ncbi:MAG TPA: hypothetical protein VGM05_27215 [Planctomycetaceae bacterium]|jgi:hypothetical protein
MKNSTKADLAVILLGAIGIAIVACGRGIMWAEDSAHIESRYGTMVLGAGLVVALMAIAAAVQWKLLEWFFTSIRWINRRDDPRHQQPPPDAP